MYIKVIQSRADWRRRNTKQEKLFSNNNSNKKRRRIKIEKSFVLFLHRTWIYYPLIAENLPANAFAVFLRLFDLCSTKNMFLLKYVCMYQQEANIKATFGLFFGWSNVRIPYKITVHLYIYRGKVN